MKTQPMGTMHRFLAKLRELVKERLGNGALTAEAFEEIVRQARSHTGGVARGERFRQQAADDDGADDSVQNAEPGTLPEDVKALPAEAQALWRKTYQGMHSQHPDDPATCEKMAWNALKLAGWRQRGETWVKASEEGQMNPFRLLGEVALSEDGKSGQVQIFPAVGTYQHPRYGKLAITKEFLETVKRNFDGKVYQQDLPLSIDLEHETKLSGAAGWIKDVEIRGDDGMWATVAFNDRGQSLVATDAYRYFSPEFYDSWQDPATSRSYKDLLIGGALTNRPFFKGMSPVAMMGNEGALVFAEDAAGEDDGDEAPDLFDVLDCLEDCRDDLDAVAQSDTAQAAALKPVVAQLTGLLQRLVGLAKNSPGAKGPDEGKEKKAGEGGEPLPLKRFTEDMFQGGCQCCGFGARGQFSETVSCPFCWNKAVA